MCDDPTSFGRRFKAAGGVGTLQLVARTLGVPVASFCGPGDEAGAGLAAKEAAYLLGLVREHFRRVPDAHRRAFAEAVRGLADGM